jgi:AraC-like DNA-binding protein
MSTRERLRLPEGLAGQVWFMDHPAPPRRRFHRHDELEFNLITAGRAGYLVEDRRFELSPGTLLWLYPEQDHVLVNESSDFAMFIAVFRPSLLRRLCRDPAHRPLRQPRPTHPLCRRLGRGATSALGRLLVHVASLDAAERDRINAGLGHVLLEAWAAFDDAEQAAEGTDVHPAVERAARVLRDDTQPQTIEQLAAQVGLSPAHLSRLFRQQTGVSITRFRQRCALDRFVEAYGSGHRVNLMAAALEAGFGSYAQFHRVFREHFGYGPSEYRRRLRQDDPRREFEP